MNAVNGKCLCGAVRFNVTPFANNVGLCHCKMCRQWCGGLPFANVSGKIVLSASESLKWWKSSSWGERGFCAECGTSLFWRESGGEEYSIVAVGALDDERALTIHKHIFIDDKASFYEFADDAPRKTGAEHTAEVLITLTKRYGEDFLKTAIEQARAHNGDAYADEVRRLTDKTIS